MAKAKTTGARMLHSVIAAQPPKLPPEISESAPWRRAAALIEQARQWRTPDYDPATYGIAQVAEALQMLIALALYSGEYDAHPAGLPAQLVRGMAVLAVNLQDRAAVMQ